MRDRPDAHKLGGVMEKRTGVCWLGFSAWGAGVLLPVGLAGAAGRPAIHELRPITIVDVQVEGRQALLKSADGRFFTVPVDTPGLQQILDEAAPPAPEGLNHRALTVQDIIDLLAAGISEETIREYVRGGWRRGVGWDGDRLTKEDLLKLKEAGASEALLRFLIRGRAGQRVSFITPAGPSRPHSHEAPPTEIVEPSGPQVSGIPYYPFAYPGFSFIRLPYLFPRPFRPVKRPPEAVHREFRSLAHRPRSSPEKTRGPSGFAPAAGGSVRRGHSGVVSRSPWGSRARGRSRNASRPRGSVPSGTRTGRSLARSR